MKRINFFLLIFFAIFLKTYAGASDNQMRAKNLYTQVRCPTCQGQSIEDTNTEHAKMLREYIDTQITQGKTDEEILENIRIGYGEFIVFKPKFSYHTLMLWIIPLFALFSFLMLVRRRLNVRQ
jgi:cytochrome c-type biogenesis protein CcmH